jgi:aminopeptidase 2
LSLLPTYLPLPYFIGVSMRVGAHPQHYTLAIKTDLQSLRYAGELLIDLSIKSDTSKLTFNVHPSVKITHLAISSAELKSTSSLALPLSDLSVDDEQERGTIKLDKVPGGGLKAGGEAKVWMRFEAELGGSMAGYYKSEGDLDAQGKKAV